MLEGGIFQKLTVCVMSGYETLKSLVIPSPSNTSAPTIIIALCADTSTQLKMLQLRSIYTEEKKNNVFVVNQIHLSLLWQLS